LANTTGVCVFVCQSDCLSVERSSGWFCYNYYYKYEKLTSLHHCVKATKSHIQNSRNHFTKTQSDRTTNWLPLQTM